MQFFKLILILQWIQAQSVNTVHIVMVKKKVLNKNLICVMIYLQIIEVEELVGESLVCVRLAGN